MRSDSGRQMSDTWHLSACNAQILAPDLDVEGRHVRTSVQKVAHLQAFRLWSGSESRVDA